MRQVCVIGLSQFGSHLARQLVKMSCEVLVIDRNEQRVNELRDEVQRAVIGDARSYEMLETVIPNSLDEAVLSLGSASIEPSILCALHLKQIGVSRIVSTARSDDHAQILRAIGTTEIIYPERETADRVARRIANPALRDMFSLAGDYRILEVEAPSSIHNKSLQEMKLRDNFDLLVLAIRPVNLQEFRFLPTASTIIRPKDVLMLMGRELDLARFASLD